MKRPQEQVSCSLLLNHTSDFDTFLGALILLTPAVLSVAWTCPPFQMQREKAEEAPST